MASGKNLNPGTHHTPWLVRDDGHDDWRANGIEVCLPGVAELWHIPRKAKRIRFCARPANYVRVKPPHEYEVVCYPLAGSADDVRPCFLTLVALDGQNYTYYRVYAGDLVLWAYGIGLVSADRESHIFVSLEVEG